MSSAGEDGLPSPGVPPAPAWGRGVAAGVLAAVVALALVNLVALPGLLALLPPVIALAVLVCAAGPVVEEACKYGAFRLVLRPARRGWRPYWALGLTFGALEALLKLAPLLMPTAAEGGAAALPLSGAGGAAHARLAGAVTSLLLHGALGGAVATAAARPGRGGGGIALLLATAMHMAFNTLATLAVVALERVAGEPGAQLGVWISVLLALGLLLLALAPGGGRGRPRALPPPQPPAADAAAISRRRG